MPSDRTNARGQVKMEPFKPRHILPFHELKRMKNETDLVSKPILLYRTFFVATLLNWISCALLEANLFELTSQRKRMMERKTKLRVVKFTDLPTPVRLEALFD